MFLLETYSGILASIAAGLLVGMERGWTQRDFGEGRRVAGIRTFGLLGLAGGLAGQNSDLVAAAACLGIASVMAIGYARSTNENKLSATTTVAGILTFMAGLSAVRIGPAFGLAAAAATFALLSARQSLHSILRGLTDVEIDAGARFSLVALVVLPLLPDRTFGPYGAWNPQRIWMVVVFVMGLSFLGYVIARRVGTSRGIFATAATGALVSSTAVTADLARRIRNEPEAAGPLTAGIAIASIVMFVRAQLLTFVLVPRAAPMLTVAMAPATVTAAIFALIAWRRHRDDAAPISLGNPLGFGPALSLALMVAVLSLVAHWALAEFGSHGIALVLAITGLTDVDAAIMTLANLPRGSLDDRAAGLVLALPVLANTAMKALMAQAITWGHGSLRTSAPLWAAVFASAAALIWAWS